MQALLIAGAGLAFIRDDEAQLLQETEQVAVWAGKRFSLPLRFAYHRARKHDPSITALLDIIPPCFMQDSLAKKH